MSIDFVFVVFIVAFQIPANYKALKDKLTRLWPMFPF